MVTWWISEAIPIPITGVVGLCLCVVLTALPIVLVMFVVLLVVILWLNRPEVKQVEGVEEFIAEEKRKLGPLSAGERNTLIAFGVAIVLWTLPGLVAADRLGPAPVHPQLEPGRTHRLGHHSPVRVGHRPGVADARDRPGQVHRGGPGQHPERLQSHLDHHPIIRMVKTGAVFDVIGAVLCVVGVAVMAKVVGLA